ncbi:MAG: diguanylate cyclase domain-containing protein [Burkholderiales bacterium]
MERFFPTAMETRVNDRGRGLITIAWLFVAIVILVLMLTSYGMGLLSAGRAFVGGEGLWSKAQKDMVYSLTRYARYHNEASYQDYLRALAVSLGDRQARLELEKKNPDLQIATAGFLKGRNHPDDIDGMIHLFRNFRPVPEIAKTADIWARADANIDQLMIVANRLHASVQSGTLDDGDAQLYLEQIYTINQRLMPLEDEFSYTLGTAARKMQGILLLGMFSVALVLLIAAFMFSLRLVRQNERVQHALRDGEKQLRSLLQFAPMPIVIIREADDAVVYANDHALAQFKVAAASLSGLKARDFFVHEGDRVQLMAALRTDGSLRDREVQLADTEGAAFWALLSSQRISYNRQNCLLTALNDNDARKRAQQELHYRAFHDELTGLSNRAMFMDALRTLLAKATPDSTAFALLFIDLNRFKIINDELGHEIGDQLLQRVALSLKDSVRQDDIVARLGGDEFVVLIVGCADADSVRHTAHKILKAIEPGHMLDGHAVSVTSSIGISCYPQDGTALKTLLKNADVAMYRAKEQGHSCFQFYSDLHHGTAATGAADLKPANA